MPTRSGRKCLGSVTSGTAPQAGALQKVPPPSISVTSTALNDASILASAPAPPTCIAVTDSAASASTWPEHPSIPRAFPDAAGPAEAVEAKLAPAPAPVASAAADAAAAGARACCSSCHGLSHASEAARRCREPRRTGVAFRDSPTGSGALHPALRLPPSKVRCDEPALRIVRRERRAGQSAVDLFLAAAASFEVDKKREIAGSQQAPPLSTTLFCNSSRLELRVSLQTTVRAPWIAGSGYPSWVIRMYGGIQYGCIGYCRLRL